MSFSLWLETIQRDTRLKGGVDSLWCEDSEGKKKKGVVNSAQICGSGGFVTTLLQSRKLSSLSLLVVERLLFFSSLFVITFQSSHDLSLSLQDYCTA